MLKAEYTINQGKEPDGEGRNRENEFAMEAAFPSSDMKQTVAILTVLTLFGALTLRGGNITGHVRAEGKSGADDPNCAGGNYDSRAYKFAQKVDYSAMHEFVIYLEGPIAGACFGSVELDRPSRDETCFATQSDVCAARSPGAQGHHGRMAE